ncbi:MAG: hypothetical protein IGBAC_1213 [Ignavibacteriae bacterium]|nr:MAG: hypothetical protein IGBAC_1213 [Ignavibacteriota bacterium]
MKQWLFIIALIFIQEKYFANITTDTVITQDQDIPNVYLDCFLCDEDFIKTEITFVNYVRDPNLADVQILVTTVPTSAGGEEYTLTFYGNKRFKNINDTLVFISKPTDSPDIIREKLAQSMKLGLVKYASKTSVKENLQIHYKSPVEVKPVVDKWNNWVFSIYANSNFSGEKSYKYYYLMSGFSITRITEEWKIQNSISMSYNESEYDYDILKYLNVLRGYEFNSMIVKSLGEKYSGGGFFEVSSSTFENDRISFSISPAFEYNFFPYKEFTRKQLRLMYKVTYKNIKYREETLFDKTAENLVRNSVSLTLDIQQPWGSVSTTISGSAYLHDFNKKRITLYSNLNLRIFEGLSLNLFASYSRINDQLGIPKAGATPEEVLLRRKQLATNYSYNGYVGLSYTFGSIYQSIVNPRFGSSGGMIYIRY